MAKTELAKLSDQCQELETVVEECSLAVLESQGKFERAFTLADGIRRLKAMITDAMMKNIMELQGTALGFKTDKDGKGGYPVSVVRDCLIEACLRGFNPVGNEFNIIASRFYGTKEGYTRLVKDFPGLANLKTTYRIAEMKDQGAVVECSATWRVNGDEQALIASPGNANGAREIPIRVNQFMGADAVLGKATRKLHAAIYAQLTGSRLEALPEGDVTELDTLPAPQNAPKRGVEGLKDTLGVKPKTEPETPPEPASPPEPQPAAPPENDGADKGAEIMRLFATARLRNDIREQLSARGYQFDHFCTSLANITKWDDVEVRVVLAMLREIKSEKGRA